MVAPITPIQAVAANPGMVERVDATSGASFGTSVANALESVSAAEFQADAVAVDIATGGQSGVHDLMVAMAKAELSVDLLVQVRNRALEAYQEIMRMQI
jgi:flagellar hook-basal body complex protein FliE